MNDTKIDTVRPVYRKHGFHTFHVNNEDGILRIQICCRICCSNSQPKSRPCKFEYINRFIIIKSPINNCNKLLSRYAGKVNSYSRCKCKTGWWSRPIDRTGSVTRPVFQLVTSNTRKTNEQHRRKALESTSGSEQNS